MKISKQSRRDAKTLFHACRVEGALDDGRVRTAVAAIIRQKPRGYLGTLTQLQRLVKLDIARRTAVVESAITLTAALQSSVTASLAQRHGAGLSVNFVQNPALIGGLRIQVGSDVYDGSVASRLSAMTDGL
ncbi:MAG: H(+)-transporting ATPase [Pedosphaera sp.]|nr:H(+)-transporting ATPase [Pedosphaera sp.]